MTEQHEHDWHLEYTETVAAEFGEHENGIEYVETHEKISYWLCICGATKEVNHGDPYQ